MDKPGYCLFLYKVMKGNVNLSVIGLRAQSVNTRPNTQFYIAVPKC